MNVSRHATHERLITDSTVKGLIVLSYHVQRLADANTPKHHAMYHTGHSAKVCCLEVKRLSKVLLIFLCWQFGILAMCNVKNIKNILPELQ